MKLRQWYGMIICAAGLICIGAHPFYMSIAEMAFNSDNHSLEVSIKLFTDNIEDVLEDQYNADIHLGFENEHTHADSLLSSYLKEKISVRVNGESLVFNYLGKEVRPDVTWVYIEATGISGIREMVVKNQLLLEKFSTQKNIVHLSVNGTKKSLLLQRGRVEEKVTF